MKIGVITDAHLFHKYAITSEEYRNILLHDFEDVDIIVDCGDLTDKSNLTAPQLDDLFNIFKDVNKPVYIVAGNHDSISNTTVASILELNNNIHIIRNKPSLQDKILFIPYTDDIKTLYSNLNTLVKNTADVAFSHLNITSNIYATLPFSESRKIKQYAKAILNGHIHTPESNSDIYGDIWNIGACSSLTYGDEHIPNYTIYDTDHNNITSVKILNSIIHKTYVVTADKLEDIFNDIDGLSSDYRICCRFKLPNNSYSIEIRKQIKNKLSDNSRIVDIVFDYIKDNQNKTKIKVKEDANNKLSLVEQLIMSFESDTSIILNDEIKRELYDKI